MRLLWFNLATDLDDPILGFTIRWIWALAQRVDFVHVVTMRKSWVDVPENVRVYSVGKEKGYSEPRRALEFYRILLRILREDQIDACFSHMIPIFTILAAPVLKTKGIPIVTWYAHPSLTWQVKLAHRLSTRMVASVPTAYPYKHDEKFVAIGQGIDTHLFRPDGTPPEDPPIILCVGRLSPVKDHPTLIRAAALLRERWGKPFRVVILGGPASSQDEPYVQFLHHLVEELHLKDIVSFHPPVPQDLLPDWYRRCTIHVNLTPTGSGDKVAWEAMACGRPCVAANQGFRETFGRYADHLLLTEKNPYHLERQLRWLLSLNEDKYTTIGNDLRQQVVRFHSLNRLANQLLELLHEISR